MKFNTGDYICFKPANMLYLFALCVLAAYKRTIGVWNHFWAVGCTSIWHSIHVCLETTLYYTMHTKHSIGLLFVLWEKACLCGSGDVRRVVFTHQPTANQCSFSLRQLFQRGAKNLLLTQENRDVRARPSCQTAVSVGKPIWDLDPTILKK